MYGRQYPIWNDVEACIYTGSKSWGSVDTMSLTQYVGSGRKNSHEMAEIHTTRRLINNPETGKMEMSFVLFVDGVAIKQRTFTVKNNRADKPLKTTSKLTRIKSLLKI